MTRELMDALAGVEPDDPDRDALHYAGTLTIGQYIPVQTEARYLWERAMSIAERRGMKGGMVPDREFVGALAGLDRTRVLAWMRTELKSRGIDPPGEIEDGTAKILGVPE